MLGDDAVAWQLAERLPQIECDDFALLTDLAAQQDVICAGMEETAAEYAATGRLKRVEVAEKLAWNICALRRKEASFLSLNSFWDALVDRFGTSSPAH